MGLGMDAAAQRQGGNRDCSMGLGLNAAAQRQGGNKEPDMYHFFVTPENIKDGKITLNETDANHVKNVLRMKKGDEFMVSDGGGSDYLCRISSLGEDIICDIVSTEVSVSEPSVKFFLFQGLPKSDKFEHIIQKAVELGVYEIIPVETERSIVKYDDKKQKAKTERWNKIAEGAAKQSHRGIVPEVKLVMKFSKALEYATQLAGTDDAPGGGIGFPPAQNEARCAKEESCTNPADGIILIPYENFKDVAATKELFSEIRPGMNVAIFIGPEGGFTEKEIENAVSSGANPVSLGNRILRTETAPLMLLSVLMFQMEN